MSTPWSRSPVAHAAPVTISHVSLPVDTSRRAACNEASRKLCSRRKNHFNPVASRLASGRGGETLKATFRVLLQIRVHLPKPTTTSRQSSHHGLSKAAEAEDAPSCNVRYGCRQTSLIASHHEPAPHTHSLTHLHSGSCHSPTHLCNLVPQNLVLRSHEQSARKFPEQATWCPVLWST